ncbi:MAG: ADP-ribosylglycohydrolase [Verrucomicrobiales bacterium]|jgi:ADP-ribosylglycohydrolase
MARRILKEIGAGTSWRSASEGAFGGGGSFGNGAAMRVAPLGAYFYHDLEKLVELASRSARVTHSHREGVAGAIAVASATASAVSSRGEIPDIAAGVVWENVLRFTPESLVRQRLYEASGMPEAGAGEVAKTFGNGADISAQDTVPFCVWNACRCLGDYREALLSAIEVDGDCDTNAAIVGDIVAGYGKREGIPSDWLRVREILSIGER